MSSNPSRQESCCSQRRLLSSLLMFVIVSCCMALMAFGPRAHVIAASIERSERAGMGGGSVAAIVGSVAVEVGGAVKVGGAGGAGGAGEGAGAGEGGGGGSIAMLGALPSYCGPTNDTTVCQVFNTMLEYDTTHSLSASGAALLMVNSTIKMDRKCYKKGGISLCNVMLDFSGNSITLVNSHVIAPAIKVLAMDLILDSASTVDASGQGDYPSTTAITDGVDGGGGGHAGVGGKGCTQPNANPQGGRTTGAAFMPRTIGGAGTREAALGGGVSAYGGGRVEVVLTGTLSLDGEILANGQSGQHGTQGRGGGGAGGSVIVLASNSIVGGTSSSITSNGGAGVNGGGGGGGGRVFIQAPSLTGVSVAALGGDSPSDSPSDSLATGQLASCESGGTGLYFDVLGVGEQLARTLTCHGTDQLVRAPTYLVSTGPQLNMTDLSLVQCSLIASVAEIIAPQSVSLTTGSQVKLAPGLSNQQLTINSKAVSLSSNCLIAAQNLVIDASSLEVDISSTLEFSESATINTDTFALSNLLTDSIQSVYQSRCVVSATSSILVDSQAKINAAFVVLESPSIHVQGQVTGTHTISTNCSTSLSNYLTCDNSPPSDLLIPPAVWIGGSDVSFGSNSHVTGNILALCSKGNITLLGSVYSAGLGCSAGSGVGAGGFSTGLPAGGAGHGGTGGAGGISDMPPGSAGGIAYDFDSSYPSTQGSGGGGASGGNGGGFVLIKSDDTITLEGTVTAAGADGKSATVGTGGGSGGSIVLSSHRLVAHEGVLDASGGAGGSPGGGGGGGGLLYFYWLSTPDIYKQSVFPFVKYTGGPGGQGSSSAVPLVISPGGSGNRGKSGSVPSCDAGEGGLFCEDCKPGYYKAEAGDNALCHACPGGKYSFQDASRECLGCGPGTFSPGASNNCTTCTAGHFAGTNSTNCTQCPGGSAAEPGAEVCLPCRANYAAEPGSAVCTHCEAGTFSQAGWSRCQTCTGRPNHSKYVFGDGCVYKCDVGLVYPDCITPFNRVIKSMGGAAGFFAVVFGGAFLIAAPFFWCWRRRTQAKRMQELEDMEEVRRQSRTGSAGGGGGSQAGGTRFRGYGSHAGSDYDSNSDVDAVAGGPASNGGEPIKFDDLEAPFRRYGGVGGGGGGGGGAAAAGPGRPLLKGQPSHRLSLQREETAYMLHRIYFLGTNSFDFPFALSTIPDPQLRNIVDMSRYREFATSADASVEWSKWEMRAHRLLSLVFYPLSPLIFNMWRKERIDNLWRYHLQYDHSFLQNHRARALGDSLKFGSSACSTLAWVDVLCFQNEDTFPYAVGKPCLPMVLLCSGDGSFHSPYHLDPTDQLCKSVSAYFGHAWFNYVASLNSYLRTIPAHSLFNQATLKPTLEYIRLMNHVGVGIGRKTPLSGMHVALGFVPLFCEANPMSGRAAQSLARPALIIMSIDDKQHYEAVQAERLYAGASNVGMRQPVGFSGAAGSAANDGVDRRQGGSGFTSFAAGSGSSFGGGDAGSPSRHRGRSRLGHDANGSDEDMEQDQGKLLLAEQARLELPYQAQFIENVLDGRVPAPPSKVSWLTRLETLLLRNRPRRVGQGMAGLALVFLLMCHLGITFVIAITFGQVVPKMFTIYMLVFPFVPVLVPLTGFLALVSSSVSLARALAGLNLLSIVNACVALICGLTSASSLGFVEGVLVPLCAMVINLLLTRVIAVYLAHMLFLRDVAWSRKDYWKDKIFADASGGGNGLISADDDPAIHDLMSSAPINMNRNSRFRGSGLVSPTARSGGGAQSPAGVGTPSRGGAPGDSYRDDRDRLTSFDHHLNSQRD